MSELAKTSRAKMKAKAIKMAGDKMPKQIDASSYMAPKEDLSSVQTGERPISRRAFRKGGKVVADVDGEKPKSNMGRKPRASGGMTSDDFINRNVKDANEKREGEKHIGGYKKGGTARQKRADGGSVKKGRTNINIVIDAGKRDRDDVHPPIGAAPVAPPMIAPPMLPPSGPPMGAPMGAPPMGPPMGPPMARKSGGRTIRMDAGSGSGEGRLEKIELYGKKK